MRTLIAAATTVLLIAVTAAPASAQPACGDVITEDTTLTADMDCLLGPETNALTIGAPGITLDLGGHRVIAQIGVRNQGFAGVTIRNGSVYGDTAAVDLNGVSGNVVRDLFVEGIVQGIALRNADGNRIVSNELLSAWIGVHDGSDGNVVRGNLLRGREGVINVARASHNRIIENVVRSGDDTPLAMSQSDHTVVRRNVFDPASGSTLALFDSDDNEFARNHHVQDGAFRDVGVRIVRSSRNVFRRNLLDGPPRGFWLQGGADNAFERNTLNGAVVASFTDPDADGFLVDATAAGTVLRGNLAGGFADDGVDVEAAGTLIRRNTANGNGDLGIEAVPGVIDGGGNEASGNGNPLQCVNVFC